MYTMQTPTCDNLIKATPSATDLLEFSKKGATFIIVT